jgi:hypothetical protein
MQFAYTERSVDTFSGKGRWSAVVLNQIQSFTYSENTSLLVPNSTKKMYAAPGIPHQNNRSDVNAAGVRSTKGTSITVESSLCNVRQLGSGKMPNLTMLLSCKESQTTPQIPITILITMSR